MRIEARGRLTCYSCLRSIVISDQWLSSAIRRLGRPLEEWDVLSLRCKKCGENSPQYDPPQNWSGPTTSAVSSMPVDEPDGFYGIWDTHDYIDRFEKDG